MDEEAILNSEDEQGVKSFLGKSLRELVGGWMVAFAPWDVTSYPAKGKLKPCRSCPT